MNLAHFIFEKKKDLLCISMAAAIAANAANGQSSSAVSMSLSVDDVRPVVAAAQELMNRHDLIITYEHPAYVHGNDVVDAVIQLRAGPNFSSPSVLVIDQRRGDQHPGLTLQHVGQPGIGGPAAALK